MKELDLDQFTINQLLSQYLESLGKIDELERILNSNWTKIDTGNVISLDLSRLEINQIIPSFFDHPALNNIEYLYLQGNTIKQLQSSLFEHLSSLKGLNLPNNEIEIIGRGTFSHLSNLEWLNLTSNSLVELEEYAFEGLVKLRSLSLSHNQLKNLEKSNFADLSNLEKLNLFNNKLVSLHGSEFTWLNNLTELDLQSNQIIRISNDLPSFLPNMEKLYLKHNPGFTLQHTFESRYEILEMLRSNRQVSDIAMTELLNYEDEQIIATFNQLIEDPRWDGGIGRVSNYKLSQVTGIPIKSIARKIETLITQQKLANFIHDDNKNPMAYEMHYWIRRPQPKGSINKGISDPKCLWCNNKLEDPFDACSNCGLRCEICKFSIKQTQEFDVCTAEAELACQDIFHRPEYLEWVKIYGSCPKCSQEINLNLYQVSKDYSEKVGSLVEQDMKLPATDETHQNEFLIPLALSILINLKKVKKNTHSSEEMIRKIGTEAREQHQAILNELQPLATELVLITAFLDRLEANTLTEESFRASIDVISERFEVFEQNIDIILEVHKKDKTKIEKIRHLATKGSVKSGEVGLKALVERSGMLQKVRNYVKLPTKEGLKSILNRIGRGIRDTTGDPIAWIKLGALFLI